MATQTVSENVSETSLDGLKWPEDAEISVPYWAYTNRAVYERELERLFYGPTWSYVGFADEVANPGDYKRWWIGERSVIVTRSSDGEIAVLENICAHRGMQVVWDERGNTPKLICPYHQWCYSLKGDLQGVPFKRGLDGQGGYPKDFKNAEHGLRRLRHVERHGSIWATFSDEAPSFEEFCGDALPTIDRIFTHGKVKTLGYQRQVIPCNWKMYMENLRDPYHATLMHTFYITFGLWRAGNRSELSATADGQHTIVLSENTGKSETGVSADLVNYNDTLTLEDLETVTPIPEFKDGRIRGVHMTPALIIGHQANSLWMRYVVPRGPDEMELVWTFFGYEDDTPEMTLRRRKQANLVGPAGFVSIDDSEALKFTQKAAKGYPNDSAYLELDGRGEYGDHLLTEAQIRAFYRFYRSVMGF